MTSTNESTVSQHDIDPGTGALSAKVPPTVASGLNPEGIAVSPDARSAFVTNAGPSNDISQYDIDPTTGAMSPKTPARVAPGATRSDVAVTPDGRSAYVTTFFAGVFQYDINPTTGALSPKTPASVPTGSGQGGAAVVVTSDGTSAYVTGLTTISQYHVDPVAGALSLKAPPTVPAGPNAHGIAVTPDGKHAYVANLDGGVGQDTVAQHSIDAATGGLSPKIPRPSPQAWLRRRSRSPPTAGAPTSRTSSETTSQYDIDPTAGLLSPKTPATVAAGVHPIGIAVRPALQPRMPTSKGPYRVTLSATSRANARCVIARRSFRAGAGPQSRRRT